MDELLTPEQVAEWFKTTTKSLANDRYLGRGPRFVKLGRFVRYRLVDCQAYLDENQYTRTDQRVAV